MILSPPVLFLLSRLSSAGFSAYAVGGCVRDSLLGKQPHDWDLCTNALPEETKEVFSAEHQADTGLKHGTVTVILDHIPYEITTFRTDGDYSDHRHPDSVSFVDRVDEDLARRDFTINAMACDASGRILDLFGGEKDLSERVIRCVGDPEKRFREDALRILRALRFASVLDFDLEPRTAQCVREMYPSLKDIASERVREELVRLLCGVGCGRILRAYPEVITFLIPCLAPSVGYMQDNPHHAYTLWEHTVRAVENVPPVPFFRITMLLHDCGKPFTRTTDSSGIGHYRGHQACSARLAEQALNSLRFDKESERRILKLIEAHDIPLSTDRKILIRRLHQYGEEDLRALFQIHMADRIATGTRNPDHAREHFQDLNRALDSLLADNPCYTLKSLAVHGDELTALGFQGKEVGEKLNWLLDQVMAETLPNQKEALLQAIKDGGLHS